MNEYNFAPFYAGQKVVGSDYAPIGSKIKRGHPYTIQICHYSLNPANRLGPFWYVGVIEFPDHIWTTPKLYSPIQEISLITFSEIKEDEKLEILINN